MSGEYGTFRFGWDSKTRIAGTTVMLAQASDLPPGEPMYQQIPFLPTISTGSGGALGSGTATDTQEWAATPTRVDIAFYQGDDVTIPLTIEDPGDTTPDMSSDWDWHAQIRVLHTYHSTLVNTFSIKDEYFPPDADTPGFTLVTLFLPRSENLFVGKFRWDLYSVAPFDAADFPQPPDVIDPEPWPPLDAIRTWLWGHVTVYPRVTATDVLDDDVIILPVPPDPPLGVLSTQFVGPNGRVP